MTRIAVFPGSFDPITVGHVDIVRKGLRIFDKIVVGIGNNGQKQYMFPIEQREQWIRETFSGEPRVEVKRYSGLTVDFCIQEKAAFLIRGLRNAADFEFEKAIAHMNAALPGNIETFFCLASLPYSAISSSIVRDIIRNGGDPSKFLPDSVTWKRS